MVWTKVNNTVHTMYMDSCSYSQWRWSPPWHVTSFLLMILHLIKTWSCFSSPWCALHTGESVWVRGFSCGCVRGWPRVELQTMSILLLCKSLCVRIGAWVELLVCKYCLLDCQLLRLDIHGWVLLVCLSIPLAVVPSGIGSIKQVLDSAYHWFQSGCFLCQYLKYYDWLSWNSVSLLSHYKLWKKICLFCGLGNS